MDNLFDLAARISVDNSGVDTSLTATQRKVLSLAKEFEATEATAKKSAVGMATSMAAVNAEIGKMKIANLSADYDRFSNALKNNSTNSRKAADDFLRLLNPVKSGSKVASEAEHETRKLSEGLRVLANSAVVAEGPMGGVSSRLRALASETSEVGSLLGPAGLVVLGFAAAAAGATALGIAVFELAHKAAEAGKEILEVSEKTNLSTETVSAFKVAAELTGTTLAATGNKLAGFNVALGQAQLGSKQATAMFTEMGVSIHQTSEQALAQFLKRFNEIGPSAKRNAIEARIFRDRTGELIPLLIEMGGSLDEAKKKAYDLGISFDEVSARSAKEFEDKLKLIKLGSEGLAEQIGMRDIPTIEAAMGELSRALGLQENSWRAWGEYIGNVLSGVVINTAATVAAINQSLSNIKTGFQTGFSQIGRIAGSISGVVLGNPGAANQLSNEFNPNVDTDPFHWKSAQTPSQAYDAEQRRMQNLVANYKPPAATPVPTYSAGGGGGGKGGGGDPAAAAKRLADLRLKAVLDELRFEEDSNKRSLARQWEDFDTYRTRYISTENRRHLAVVAGLKEEMDAAENIRKSQQRAIAVQEIRNKQAQEEITHKKNDAALNDEQARLLDQLNDFLKQQVREIGYARSNTDQYDKAALELEVALKKAGFAEVERWHAMLMSNAATQRAIDLTKQLTRERRAISERPRYAEDKNFPASVGIEIDDTGATRRRRATALSDETLSRLHDLAGQITSTLSNSIHDGFDKGIKEGFRSMALGFAQMLEQMAEQWLASSIFRMLQSAFTPNQTGGQVTTGGGFLGFLKTILPFVGSALGAGFSSGGSLPLSTPVHTFTPHAMGLDYVPYDNYPAILHKGERVMTASENRSGGGVVHNHYWNITTQNARSFMSQDTQRQMAQRANKLMQHAALAG